FLLRGNYFIPKSFQLAIGPSITIRASQKANNPRSRYLYFTPSLVYSLFQYARVEQNDWSERDLSNNFIHNRITSFSGIGAKLKFEYVTGMLYTGFSLGVTVHPAVKGDGTATWRAISEYNNDKMLAVA